MNRRIAINNIVILSLGAVAFPSCNQPDQAMVNLKNLVLTGSEQKLVNQLTAAIIPKTSFIGAVDINAHAFMLMMVDDCYDPDQQKKFILGLKEFAQLAKSKYGGSFTAMTMAQRTAMLTSLEKNKDIPDTIAFFYETTRKHTIQAFTSSKEYMTDVIKYNMVPGSNFKGCVPVNKS
jgi:hypothetical protein